MAERRLTRRQVLAGGVGLGAATLTGGALQRVWTQIRREDLIPGTPSDIVLEPERWTVSDDHLSFAAIGDNGSGGRQAVAVAEELARSYQREPFGLLSMLGDICYYGPIDERFDAVFVRPMEPLVDAGVTFELAVGNHDGNIFFGEGVPDVQATLEVLGTPSRYYSISRGPADFFYLDSGTLGLLGRPGDRDRQLEWLDDELASASRAWRIVCLHHPLYSSGTHGSDDRVRELLEPILVRHQVDLVLSGHDHHYERTEPIDGVTYVVSGAGCKLTPVGSSPFTARAVSTLQFMRFDIDGDRLTGRCLDIDGEIVDRFQLRTRVT